MRAIQVPDYGESAAMKPFDVTKPAPGTGEKLVRMAIDGVCRGAIKFRRKGWQEEQKPGQFMAVRGNPRATLVPTSVDGRTTTRGVFT
jgi:D-arabinose 1-dehydrogenase-like Zn-dependent alcohol dehydrogenase